MARFPTLKLALERWARASLRFLEDNRSEATRYRDEPTWIAMPSGALLKSSHQIAWFTTDKVFDLPDWGAVVSAAEADPSVRGHLETLVGTPLSAHRWTLKEVSLSLIPRLTLGPEGEGWLVEPFSTFHKRYNELESILAGSRIKRTRIWPLPEVILQPRIITLDDKVHLRTLTPKEHAICLNHGLIRISPTQTYVAPEVERCACLVQTDVLPKVLGASDPALSGRLNKEDQEFCDDFHALLGVLGRRDSLSGNFEVGPFDSWIAAQGTPEQARPFGMYFRNALSRAEARYYAPTWKFLRKHGKKNVALTIAARRLHFALTRLHEEDQIIDTLIAAEALYLGTDDARGALTYRLGLRAALWADKKALNMTREDVFEIMKKAYAARSVVAHGRKPLKKDLTLRGQELPLGMLAIQVATIVRLGLRKAIREVAKNPGRRFDPGWERMLLRR